MQSAVSVLIQKKELRAELTSADLDSADPISCTNVVLPRTLYPFALLSISDET